ncbi:hypothetical protein NM688_g7078 [Phlebia brevispora]|uniref:Uncharacterized protein n=1 Tax=Phlebia brevispora TaxID=194682 RepID=A0ACC1S9B5_9APHY|nr:hypothetical protein NM688_g7078 [Phlebia brevispora]
MLWQPQRCFSYLRAPPASSQEVKYLCRCMQHKLQSTTRSIEEHRDIMSAMLKTLYLFTKSDFKSILLPIMFFACAGAGSLHYVQVFRAFFWTWMYLLQFCVSNQSLCPEEDAQNKPFRPIPSGHITIEQARRVRWVLIPVCLAVSTCCGVLVPGITLTIHFILHNELRLDANWITRNVLNALGYCAFDSGASGIVDVDASSHSATATARHLSFMIILTTIHAQDFRDEAGDRNEGRETIPIVMPAAGRLSMPVTLLFWSLVLTVGWCRNIILGATLIGLGVLVGSRFYFVRNPAADRTSYLLYNLWLTLARIVPLITTAGLGKA